MKTGCATHSGSSNLPLGASIFKGNSIKKESEDVNISLNDFEKFLCVQKLLSRRTVESHLINIKGFLRHVNKPVSQITPHDVQEFLGHIKETKSPGTYRNYLSALKVFFRDFIKRDDLVNDYKFPRQIIKPKTIPSQKDILLFYNSLSSARDKALFLMLATSGLRVSEVISLSRSDIDFKNRMIIPRLHTGQTKQSYIAFYNGECEKVLMEYLSTNNHKQIFTFNRDRVSRIFKLNSRMTGISITPQDLRSVFAREMSLRGVPDRYIDAFCGRVPQSVLAKHYSDFSPEILKQIYDKANLRYFD